jgi:septum formation protein
MVLASSSAYRAAVMSDAGREVTVVAPDLDEDALRHLFAELGPERYALELAARKARSVVGAFGDDVLVVGADQVGVRTDDGRDVEVGKPATVARAVAQLMAVSGRSFRLVNGLVVVRASDGEEFAAAETHEVHMRPFDGEAAREYVERFQPLDCVGGCRIEDPSGLVDRVEGSGIDGVMGMPMGLLDTLIAQACPR